MIFFILDVIWHAMQLEPIRPGYERQLIVLDRVSLETNQSWKIVINALLDIVNQIKNPIWL